MQRPFCWYWISVGNKLVCLKLIANQVCPHVCAGVVKPNIYNSQVNDKYFLHILVVQNAMVQFHLNCLAKCFMVVPCSLRFVLWVVIPPLEWRLVLVVTHWTASYHHTQSVAIIYSPTVIHVPFNFPGALHPRTTCCATRGRPVGSSSWPVPVQRQCGGDAPIYHATNNWLAI